MVVAPNMAEDPAEENQHPPGHAVRLLEKVRKRQATLAVVGLGYVGLPTAVAFSKASFHVIGADLDHRKVDAINGGKSPLKDLGLDEDVKAMVQAGRLVATQDVESACRDADIILLIVPTPVDASKQPDLSFVRKASQSAAKGLRPGQFVILESTTYPGTTEEIVQIECERISGLLAGRDFGLAYCPERYNPGDAQHRLDNVHRVVGAIDAQWNEVAALLYGTLNGGKITKVRNLKTAEAAKVIENIQRDLNIALANELALIFDRVGIDTHEVLDAAATKWNFVKYAPGPGVGGHCLPVDPYYLTNLAERLGYHPRVILAGRAVNDAMPLHVVDLLVDALNEAGKPVLGTPIAVLGLAYKANTGDARESPAEHVVKELKRRGAALRMCDPHVPHAEFQAHFGVAPMSIAAALQGAAAVILLTDHTEFRQSGLAMIRAALGDRGVLVDTRNMYDPEAARACGLIFRGVGRRRDA